MRRPVHLSSAIEKLVEPRLRTDGGGGDREWDGAHQSPRIDPTDRADAHLPGILAFSPVGGHSGGLWRAERGIVYHEDEFSNNCSTREERGEPMRGPLLFSQNHLSGTWDAIR